MTDQIDPDDIPAERDRATGETGELGVWPEKIESAPAPLDVWDGRKAVLAHATQAHLGEHIEAGEDIALVFSDRALLCSVDEVVTADSENKEGERDDA